MSFAIDANILVEASNTESPRHERAQAAIRAAVTGSELYYLFWPVITAYLRVVTHPGVFTRPLALDIAIDNVSRLLRLPNARTGSEPADFWEGFLPLLRQSQARAKLVHDAHIVALMQRHGVGTVWTHDRDFRRFDGIRVVDPLA